MKEALELEMGGSWTKNGVAFNQRYFRLNESCQRCHSRKQNFYDCSALAASFRTMYDLMIVEE
jgi:hypothetical protein